MTFFTLARLAVFGALSLAIAACDDPAGNRAEAPSLAEQACLRDVTQTTGNPDVTLISSDVSEAGTLVIAGVGEQRAQWSCIGYADGTTAEITSLTDEGTL